LNGSTLDIQNHLKYVNNKSEKSVINSSEKTSTIKICVKKKESEKIPCSVSAKIQNNFFFFNSAKIMFSFALHWKKMVFFFWYYL